MGYDGWDIAGGVLGGIPGLIASGGINPGDYMNSPDLAREQERKKQLALQAAAAGGFANQAQGNYGNMTQQGMQSINDLRALANGQHSIAGEQLRQGMQQGLAAQQAMAASASPQNAAMAARNAAMNMGRLGYGLSGQQALAGLQERQMANQTLAGLIQGMRGQDVQGALGSRGNAINGLSSQAQGAPQQSLVQQYGPMVMGAGQMMAASDERLKKNVSDETETSKAMLSKLRAVAYDYKDEKYGKGRQFGIMAQDLEKAGLGHAVVDTPSGKMVHGAKLATSLAGLVAAMNKRVSKLEDQDA